MKQRRRMTTLAILFLAALASSCSWVLPVRVPDKKNPDRLAYCSAVPATIDTVAIAGYGLAATLLVSMPGSEEDCSDFGCMGPALDKALAAVILLGIVAVQGAAAVTGWIRYGCCRGDLSEQEMAEMDRLVPLPSSPPRILKSTAESSTTPAEEGN